MTYIGQQPATTFDSGIQDRFTGLSSNTVTLTHEIAAEEDILVVWNNIVQDKNTYSVGGTGNKTVTLGGTLVSADVVTVYYLNKVMQSVNPTAGSVGITELNLSDGSNGQAITTNGSGTLSFATLSSDLNFGGDTFGADKTIGSNDAYALSFETNNAVGLKIDNAGHVTKPLNPAFRVYQDSPTDYANGHTMYNQNITEVYDVNSDISTSGTFTAPVTGKYLISVSAYDAAATENTTYDMILTTSNRTYRWGNRMEYRNDYTGYTNAKMEGNLIVDMDASDTCTVTCGSSVTITNASNTEHSYFSGILIG